MAQPGQQRRRGGLRLAVLLLAALLLSLCLLARVDAAAVATTVSAGVNLERKEGVMTTSLDEAVGQEATTAAAEEEEDEEGDRPERVEMESINDYVPFGANNRHTPHP